MKQSEEEGPVEVTIPQVQREVTSEYPERDFLVDLKSGRRFTYQEFDEKTDRVARSLIGLGVEKGDRLGIAMNNNPEWVMSFFSAFKVGAYPVNIGPRLKEENFEYLVNQPGLKCLIGDDRNSNYGLEKDYHSLQSVVSVSEDENKNAIEWEELMEGRLMSTRDRLEERIEGCVPGDIAGLCYTSGTTGDPKGAMLSHSALINEVRLLKNVFGYRSSDVIPLAVPMFHIFGWVLSLLSMYSGMELVLPTSYVRPDSILECLEEEQCTTMGSAPQIYRFFVESPDLDDFDISSLRHCFSGSDVLPRDLVDAIYERLGVDAVQNVWGATEMGGAITVSPKDAPRDKITKVGKVLPGCELKVVDPENGESVPRGEEGEIWVRGPILCDGYWEMEEKTSQKIDSEGWLKSGDLGTLDEDGYVGFEGRVDEVFKKGAKKIAPAPIENVLSQHSDIREAGVVGVPDQKYGLEVGAFVQLREDALEKIQEGGEKAAELEKEVRQFARAHLESFKVPKYIEFVGDLPRTATGKIKHFILEQEAKSLKQNG